MYIYNNNSQYNSKHQLKNQTKINSAIITN